MELKLRMNEKEECLARHALFDKLKKSCNIRLLELRDAKVTARIEAN